MFFWNSLAFLMIQQMLAIWSLVPLPFLKPSWTSGSSQSCPLWPQRSPPGFSVHGIPQARILVWVVISFSRERSWVSCTASRFFTVWASVTTPGGPELCLWLLCDLNIDGQKNVYSIDQGSVRIYYAEKRRRKMKMTWVTLRPAEKWSEMGSLYSCKLMQWLSLVLCLW